MVSWGQIVLLRIKGSLKKKKNCIFASTCPHLHTRIPPPYTARDTSSCDFLKVKDTVNNAQKNVSGFQYTTPGSFITRFKVRTHLS